MFKQVEQYPIIKQPLFYFKFQMRLQFIPFVEQQIKQFINFIQHQIDNSQHVAQILVILNKRIRDIDRFYDQNWSDYRAQQILRSRQQLVQFCKRNHAKLFIRQQRVQDKVDASPVVEEKRPSPKSKQVKNISKQVHALKQSPIVMKKQAINLERVRKSSSKSNQRQKNQKYAISNKASPYVASLIIQSPSIPIKSSISRQKDKQSPIRGIKMKDSPVEKKVAQKKMTKQQYILHLRNKKANQ